MAWLEQKKNGAFHVVFRIGDEKYRRSLKTNQHKEALGRRLRIEENLKLVESGRPSVPPDGDLVSFLLSDGRLDQRVAGHRQLPVGKLYQTYVDCLPLDALEASTLKTAANHMRHVTRILGGKTQVRAITTVDLQKYVNQRSREPGKLGRTVSSVTIKKELDTLRTIWNWSRSHGYVANTFPSRGVVFPKSEERQPFRTRDEIERLVASNGLEGGELNQAWEALYLRVPEIRENLSIVKRRSDCLHV